MPLTATFANTGKNQAFLWLEHAEPIPFDVTVTMKDGTPVPMTRWGRRELVDRPQNWRQDARSGKLAPSTSCDLLLANLGLFYDLTLPGEYSITASRTVEIGKALGGKYVVPKTNQLILIVTRE